jgi:hypothetical protein
MVLIQGALAAVFRSAGKILNTVFGWATILLFGKVSRSRQLYMSGINFGSVIWLVALVGVAYPPFATWMFGFVTLPKWINDQWIRPAMIVAVILIPPILGGLSVLMLEPGKRPTTMSGRFAAIARGYPNTLSISVTLIMLTVFAPFMMLPSMLRRWTTQHVPVIVQPSDYLPVVEEAEKVLDEAGFDLNRAQASWMMRYPTKVLTTLAGGAVKNVVADELAVLKGKDLQVTLHPSDLVISGKERSVARARAMLSERMAFSPAYFTWDKEANALEDRLAEIWAQLQTPGMANDPELRRKLTTISRLLQRVDFPYEEWEVLFRQQLLVERKMLESGASHGWLRLLPAPQDEVGSGNKVQLTRKLLTKGVLLAASLAADELAGRLNSHSSVKRAA